jgi:hypothetical protein
MKRRLFSASLSESSRKEKGVALLIVITWLALMTALVGELTFGTAVDTAQAANARDELKAHYMARSAVNLSRLLIKIQKRFIEPVMTQMQKTIQQLMGGGGTDATGKSAGAGQTVNPAASLGISLRITDYAAMLMGFFSGSKEEVTGLGSLIGLDISQAKGLGMKSGRFDAEIIPEDGKINLNCPADPVGDVNLIRPKQLTVFRLISGLTYSPRYDRLFSESDTGGQFYSRLDVARALMDWADVDPNLYSPEGGSGSEDYRYDGDKDPYKAHDSRYDTVEEMKQVRGVTDGFLEAFGPYFTVYPSGDPQTCKVNLGGISNRLGGDCAPLLMGVIRAAAMGDPTKPTVPDPVILDDKRLYPLVTVMCDRASAAGLDSLNTLTSIAQKPETAVLVDDPRYKVLQGMRPLDLKDLEAVAYVGPPRTYRVVATGRSGKVTKKITAIVDTGRMVENPLTLNPQSEQAAGVLQYWREE